LHTNAPRVPAPFSGDATIIHSAARLWVTSMASRRRLWLKIVAGALATVGLLASAGAADRAHAARLWNQTAAWRLGGSLWAAGATMPGNPVLARAARNASASSRLEPLRTAAAIHVSTVNVVFMLPGDGSPADAVAAGVTALSGEAAESAAASASVWVTFAFQRDAPLNRSSIGLSWALQAAALAGAGQRPPSSSRTINDTVATLALRNRTMLTVDEWHRVGRAGPDGPEPSAWPAGATALPAADGACHGPGGLGNATPTRLPGPGEAGSRAPGSRSASPPSASWNRGRGRSRPAAGRWTPQSWCLCRRCRPASR